MNLSLFPKYILNWSLQIKNAKNKRALNNNLGAVVRYLLVFAFLGCAGLGNRLGADQRSQGGDSKDKNSQKSVASESPKDIHPARPRFRKTQIHLAQKTIEVEVAENPEQLAFGLMYVQSLKKDTGMIFIFDQEQTLAFWMKNTFVPLDVGYFNNEQKLIDVQTMKPAPNETSPRNYPSRKPARYALEMSAGWFKKNKIKVGDKFSF